MSPGPSTHSRDRRTGRAEVGGVGGEEGGEAHHVTRFHLEGKNRSGTVVPVK